MRRYEFIGKGCHRDAIKIKMDLDMTMPMSSVGSTADGLCGKEVMCQL